MRIRSSFQFRRLFRRLPAPIRRKALRQIRRMARDARHPSLQVKKIKGAEGVWEARVDLRYRMTFELSGGAIFLRVIGNHDDVLRMP